MLLHSEEGFLIKWGKKCSDVNSSLQQQIIHKQNLYEVTRNLNLSRYHSLHGMFVLWLCFFYAYYADIMIEFFKVYSIDAKCRLVSYGLVYFHEMVAWQTLRMNNYLVHFLLVEMSLHHPITLLLLGSLVLGTLISWHLSR